MTIDFDARRVRQRLPLGLRRLGARDALPERLPRCRFLFASDFHTLSFSDAM